MTGPVVLAFPPMDLQRQKIPDSKTLNAMPDGSRTQYVGMVIC